MNFAIKTKRSAITMKKVYYVSDSEDMYGPFSTYKEATNFMEEQLSILKEGSPSIKGLLTEEANEILERPQYGWSRGGINE
jgi:hypothetical protein